MHSLPTPSCHWNPRCFYCWRDWDKHGKATHFYCIWLEFALLNLSSRLHIRSALGHFCSYRETSVYFLSILGVHCGDCEESFTLTFIYTVSAGRHDWSAHRCTLLAWRWGRYSLISLEIVMCFSGMGVVLFNVTLSSVSAPLFRLFWFWNSF